MRPGLSAHSPHAYHLGVGREIPGSAFERGDDEGRTWDEMGWWDQPFSAQDDDNLVEVHAYDGDAEEEDPTTLDDWMAGWGEPLMPTTEHRLLAELDDRIQDLEERIWYRDMAAAAGEAVDATAAARDGALRSGLLEFRRRHPDSDPEEDEPALGVPDSESAPPARTESALRQSPIRLVQAAIEEGLTPEELFHWQELQKGTTQTSIAEKLGISQGAVSKRERVLRVRIDAISVETVGRTYPERLVDRGKWPRQGRRRNKNAPRQR